MFTSPGGPKFVVCFTGQSDDETLGPWIDARGYANVTFYTTGIGTTSSGVITFEECDSLTATQPSQPYNAGTGKFSVVDTRNAVDVNGGAQVADHFPPNAAYGFVRGRISTAVGGGGTVTVTAELS